MSNIRTSGWKRSAFALILATATFAGGTAAAQDFAASWDPRSGDVWVDTWLADMNRYGARYPEPFIDEMVRYHHAPRALVVDLLQTRRWAPGDVYYACALASVLGRPCRYVADIYEADRGQGWGVVAQRLGIKPGSPEFHRLKKGFVPTYDRWGRPINLDDDLRREYPDRGKGNGSSQRKSVGKSGGPASTGKGQGSQGKGKAPKGNSSSHGADAQGGKPEDKGTKKGNGKGNGNG